MEFWAIHMKYQNCYINRWTFIELIVLCIKKGISKNIKHLQCVIQSCGSELSICILFISFFQEFIWSFFQILTKFEYIVHLLWISLMEKLNITKWRMLVKNSMIELDSAIYRNYIFNIMDVENKFLLFLKSQFPNYFIPKDCTEENTWIYNNHKLYRRTWTY